MVNALTLQGRLTKDVVNKNGNAHFSIATTNFKGETMYVDVVAFKQTAEYAFTYLSKGNMVIVEGSLSINKYQDKIYVSCVARNITSVGNNNKEKNIDKVEEIQAKEEMPTETVDIDFDDSSLPF